MQNGSSSKIYIVIAIVIVLAGGAYYLYQSGDKTSTDAVAGGSANTLNTTGTTAVDESGEAVVAVGADILPLLNQIKSLKIDPAFFAGTAYLSLVDFSVTIPDQNVGRANPFAPLPGYSVPQSQGAAAAARTLPHR